MGNYKDSMEADALTWPNFSESDISKYAEIFRIMDRDKDGKITGEQARTLFLSWKIAKGNFLFGLSYGNFLLFMRCIYSRVVLFVLDASNKSNFLLQRS